MITIKHRIVICDCCGSDITPERFYTIKYRRLGEFPPFYKNQICKDCYRKIIEQIRLVREK